MPTARSYVTAGAALVGAGVITATPITTPNLGESTARWDVALAAATQSCAGENAGALCTQPEAPTAPTPFAATQDATNVFNIPANLFIALANTPFNFFTALGEGNVQLGSDPEGDFDFQPTYEGVTLTQPDGSVPGLGRNLRYTGSWWLYSQTNILGTDPADPSRYQAITNILIPFPELAVPLGNIVATVAASQLPMATGCTGTGPGACDDPADILSKMFNVSAIPALFSPEGYTFPETRAGITCDESGQCYVKDEDGPEVPWSGQTVRLDATEPFTNFYDSLTGTPDYSAIKPLTAELVVSSLISLGTGLNTAFNPFVLGTQCTVCAPFVPNPDNEPVPGPVFEDPDVDEPTVDSVAAESVAAAPQDVVDEVVTPSAPAPTTETDDAGTVEDADIVEEPEVTEDADEPASTGPKHRKPSSAGQTLRQVRDSISSSFSKVTDSFGKRDAEAGDSDSSAGKSSDGDAGSGKDSGSRRDSGSGSDSGSRSDSGSGSDSGSSSDD
ncbi:hypothetical protein ACEWX3_14050 [Mycobacterium sp. G7A2]|uniref:hypothetical protein n=1 Tax=Mycobacterium sp. G7A2 TaxID=3317307 RepID=UPI0035A8C70E